jgi:cholesterol transport system auxiliary component
MTDSFKRFALVLVAGTVTGCALLTKQDPVEPRYFSPESSDGNVGAAPAPRRAAEGHALRLGSVGGGSYLKDRIVYRKSREELGFYPDKRWTERPEIFLRRALERALFEKRGLSRALTGASPTLTADLIEFEEVRSPPAVGRVRIAYALHDDRSVLREGTLTVERPIPPGGLGEGAMVAALGAALRAIVEQIADQVVSELEERPVEPATTIRIDAAQSSASISDSGTP